MVRTVAGLQCPKYRGGVQYNVDLIKINADHTSLDWKTGTTCTCRSSKSCSYRLKQ